MAEMRLQNAEFLEKVALFYYFSFLDEAKAQAVTARTLKKFRLERIEKNKLNENASDVELVGVTNEFIKKHKKKAIHPLGLSFSAGSIVLPDKSNWGPWFEFRKSADERDFHALLYSRILGLSDASIAAGLLLPLGTVRYRLGRALKHLGKILNHSGSNK